MYLKDLAVSRASICLCVLFCFLERKPRGDASGTRAAASDWLWADTGLETRSQSADGIEGIQTEAARLQGAGIVLTDRQTNKWTTSVRSGPSPGFPSGCRHGRNFSSAPSRLVSSD